MENSNRSRRRAYLTSQTFYKIIKSSHALNSDRIMLSRNSMHAGQKISTENFERVQREVVDSLSIHESRIMDKLKVLNLKQDVIDNYMEVWADLNMWPKSKNASNKKLAKLNKELGV